ncbi:MAG TPA: ribbon-helix-helix domain-containing protein [Candidatus Nanoarchaeia archaeon]|nr:ribbon-helix-helix domain-containing protein [Candidatus Nanoarchaeia archaeon]
MKTLTVKLPENEARELDAFIKRKKLVSKSEFVRHLILEKLDRTKKEKIGWLVLAEKSMAKIWDNKKDDETWNAYL